MGFALELLKNPQKPRRCVNEGRTRESGRRKRDAEEPNVEVQAAGTRLVFDKGTGQIASWRAGNQVIVLGGPVLNIGESIRRMSPAAPLVAAAAAAPTPH